MIRTYKHNHDINKEKQKKIFAVLKEYRKSCKEISKHEWFLFFKGDGFDKLADIKEIPSKLSERYKRNCTYQVVGTLESFISNRQNDFIAKVYSSSLDKETLKHLLQINRRKLWFKKVHSKFSQEELFLARKIFKHILSKHSKPSFGHINMLLNKNVAEIIPCDKNKSPEFDYWIKLATIEKGKPIMLPVKHNPYFEKLNGKILQAVQINFNRKNEITVGLMKDLPAKLIVFKTAQISIDIGLKNLFALDNGQMFGKDFYKKLKHYDTILTEHTKKRQQRGLKTRTEKYNLLNQKLRAYLKNEIGRLLNRIIKINAPKKIVIEKLDFRHQNLSKQMNRLLSRFGKKYIEEKLKSINEEFHIEIQYINPAYTSQECNHCHYVDKKNRPSQEKFKCKNCHKKINADVNSARNHTARSSDVELNNIYLNKKTILRKLVIRFVERNPRHYSLANGLLLGNPYFSDYLKQYPKLAS